MEGSKVYQLGLLIAFCLGAAAAAVAVSFMLRKSTNAAVTQARTEAQIETARVTERSAFQATQIESFKSNLQSADAKAVTLQRQVDECNVKRAVLGEQASRVAPLEQRLREAVDEQERTQRELLECREQLAGAQAAATERQSQLTNLGEEVLSLNTDRNNLLTLQSQLRAQVAQLTATLGAEREQSTEKIALLNEAREELTASFRNLANDILEEKSQKFADLNKTNLTQILDPLRAKIQEFQTQVENAYLHESTDRAALGEQVRQLLRLNQQLSDDAHNLTKALKGSGKQLGNWGEMILDQILESSGLHKGQQYLIRPTYTKADGKSTQPDAVVLLPENRTLVVDAKASLAAYDEYVRAETDELRNAALAKHARAVRNHLDGLSVKEYQNIPSLNCPDFVIMFVPIEPAFIDAVRHDRKLWEDAWNKNVLLVSPSILLFVIRIVANLWAQENQKKHYQEIADRGAALYDKLVGFTEDLEAVGDRLAKASAEYESAFKKFSTGNGNVIRQAQMLKDLGVRPSKNFPQQLLGASDEPVSAEVHLVPTPTE